MSSSSSSTEGYLSPTEAELVNKTKSYLLKNQRRQQRKQKLLETQHATLHTPPSIVSLPILTSTRCRDQDDQDNPPPQKKQKLEHKMKKKIEQPTLDVIDQTNGLYMLKPISEIIRDRPHLGMNSKDEPICERGQSRLIKNNQLPPLPSMPHRPSSGSSSGGSKITTADMIRSQLRNHPIHPIVQQHHQEQLKTNVIDDPWFKVKLQALSLEYPLYHSTIDRLHDGECTTTLLQSDLQRPRISLEVRFASHESLLLQEAGRWYIESTNRYIFFPACSTNHQCIGMIHWRQIKGLVGPLLLMSTMTPNEYQSLLTDDPWEDDDHGFERKPCVLCSRFIASALIISHRHATVEGLPTPLQTPTNDPSRAYDVDTQPIQSYYNLMDEEEGYYSQYVLKQGPRDICFQPIVMANVERLSASQHPNPCYRRYINQDLLIWQKNHTPVLPSPGMTIQHFLTSNKQSVGKGLMNRKIRDANTVKSMILCLLLQYQPLDFPTSSSSSSSSSSPPLINHLQCEQSMKDPTLPPIVSYIYTQIYDACLHSPSFSPLTRIIPWSSLSWLDVNCDLLLPDCLPLHIQNASFFSPLAEVTSPLAHLISKIIVNFRCQSRTVSVIISKLLVKRTIAKRQKSRKVKTIEYDDQVLYIVKQVILCGLLGNYINDVLIRPYQMKVRQWLYHLFTTKRYDPWIVRLLQHCPSVLTFCIRKYMIYSLDCNPAMLSIISTQIRYPEYKKIVEYAMSQLCQLFIDMIMTSSSSPLNEAFHDCLNTVPMERCNNQHLWTCGHKQCKSEVSCMYNPTALLNKPINDIHIEDKKRDEQTGWSMHAHLFHTLLQAKLEPFELQIKEISFRRAHVNISALLRPQRTLFPLIPIGKEESEEEEPEEEEEEGGCESDDEDEDKEEKEEYRKEKEQDNYLFPKNQASQYLHPNQLKALHWIIDSCGPVGFGLPIQRILDFLPCFGVSTTHVIYIKQLFHYYRNQTTPMQTIQRAIATLRLLDPHAYNLIQLISECIEQAQRRFRLTDLPLHITQAQIDTIQHLHSGSLDKTLLESAVSFVFCPVCFHVYSHISDYNSVYKNSYELGLRDASVSYLTGKTYCKSNKTNHRGACGVKELVRIPMIGRMLWFRLKLIVICAQVNCSVLMAFDGKEQSYTAYNQRGPACISCTKKIINKSCNGTMEMLEQTYKNNPLIHCYYCNDIWPKPILKDPSRTHLYTRDYFLCEKHHEQYKDIIQQDIQTEDQDQEEDTIILTVLRKHMPLTEEEKEYKRKQEIERVAENITVTIV